MKRPVEDRIIGAFRIVAALVVIAVLFRAAAAIKFGGTP